MPEFLPPFEGLGPYLLNIASAVAVLVVGWLIAVVARALTRWGLRRTGLDRRLSSMSAGDGAVNLTSWISRAVYYLILLLVLVIVLQQLQLTIAAESIQI
ncbi:MAG: hypothetical protein V3U32_04255, partial [Anaerolineales bacterium]